MRNFFVFALVTALASASAAPANTLADLSAGASLIAKEDSTSYLLTDGRALIRLTLVSRLGSSVTTGTATTKDRFGTGSCTVTGISRSKSEIDRVDAVCVFGAEQPGKVNSTVTNVIFTAENGYWNISIPGTNFAGGSTN